MSKKKIINTIVNIKLKEGNQSPMYKAFKDAITKRAKSVLENNKKQVFKKVLAKEDLSIFARGPMTVDLEPDWRRPVVQKFTALKNIKIGNTILKRNQEFLAVPSSTALGQIDIVFQPGDGNSETGEDVFQETTIKMHTFQKMKQQELIGIEIPDDEELQSEPMRSLGEKVKVISKPEKTSTLDVKGTGVHQFDGKNKINKNKNKKESKLPRVLQFKLDEVFRNGSFKKKIRSVIEAKKHSSMNKESEVPPVDQKLDQETKKKQKTFQTGNGEANKITEDIIKDLQKIVDKQQSQQVKFNDGKKEQVDLFTASAILQVFEKLNDRNQDKMKAGLSKDQKSFRKLADFSFQQG